MSNKKISILTRLLEQEKLSKEAQVLENAEPQVDQNTADKMANEIFNKIFDDEYQKMINELGI